MKKEGRRQGSDKKARSDNKDTGKKRAGKKRTSKKDPATEKTRRADTKKNADKQYDVEVASRDNILDLLVESGAPADMADLLDHFGYKAETDEAEGLRRRLVAMCRDAQLIRNRSGAFVPVSASDLVAGYVSANAGGFGFIICDDDKSDVYLNASQMRLVLHGDKVVACITGTDQKGRREGRITDVVERAHSELVGRLAVEPGVTFVRPENKRLTRDFLVDADSIGEAKHGDMVIMEIVEQPSRRHPPVGRIIEVMGQHLQAGMEIDVALHNHSIPYLWPEAVEKQVDGFKSEPGKKDKLGRRDITHLPLVTIDGEDARDFDDAVYCEPTDGGWRLYVAIADVSHYVTPDSALDNEAVRRGTSVYFPQRVIPMLPETLSNGLCSINPDVERLCMLCVMSLDQQGNLKRTRFQRAVMRSHARLTYMEVGKIIEQQDSKLRQKHEAVVKHLENLHSLYELLAELRKGRGCIEFASQETRFVFDDNRKIQSIVPVQRNVAHRMIEESMILANVAAAAFLLKRKMPALYRVHQGPTEDRLDDLRSFLALRGLEIGGGDKPDTADFAKLAALADDLPDARVIHAVMLRSMQAAVYQPDNDGHFGLALPHYAHFTSPIRRYPDLLVHRAIAHAIEDGKASDYSLNHSDMVQLGESCSMTERRADEATREVDGWLKCEYMSHHIGDTFDGIVTSVTSFGMFVQLEDLFVDGLVHVSSLGFDYFHFDSAGLTLTGERTGTQFRLGDPVSVEVTAVNLDERKIDFELQGVTVGRGKRRKSSDRKRGAKDKVRGKDRGRDKWSDKSADDDEKSNQRSGKKSKRKSTEKHPEKRKSKSSDKPKDRGKSKKKSGEKKPKKTGAGAARAENRKARKKKKQAMNRKKKAAAAHSGTSSKSSSKTNSKTTKKVAKGKSLYRKP